MAWFGKEERMKGEATTASPSAMPRRRMPSFTTTILVAMLVIGTAVIAYPTFSDWWNSYHQSRAIASYSQEVEKADPKVLEYLLKEAHAYNEEITKNGNLSKLSEGELEEYDDMLNLNGSGIMGYIQMASLGIDYPIYHGVEEQILQIAIGHFPGSSLPVGGASTHAVVTGHRGLPSARLFTDLDRAREGDTFTINVLGQTLTYEVDQIHIVLPEDLSDLRIAKGKDYVTLVTCTPYGINSHRLLVRGHRVDNLPSTRVIPGEAVQIPNYVTVPVVGIPVLFVYLAVSLMVEQHDTQRGHVDRAKALEELRGGAGFDGFKK